MGRFTSAVDTFRVICESESVFRCILGFGMDMRGVQAANPSSSYVRPWCRTRLPVGERLRSLVAVPAQAIVMLHPAPLRSTGESQFPTKLAVLSLEVRRVCASLLLRGLSDRLRNGIARGHAVHLLACNADCRPLHCCERVRSPRIAYSRELSLMREIALILDVHLEFRPA